ncbi:MAG: dihydroxyacetone kinase subunit L [Clostridium sp.]
MLLSKEELKQMFLDVADIWKRNHDRLSEIDSKFGDGDHGVTINKIALLIEKKAKEWTDEQTMAEFIDALGTGIIAINGGSAGPLYGTMVGGLAIPLGGKTEIDALTLKAMLRSSLTEMQDISTAKVGDKTMMDALIPAVIAAEESPNDIPVILKAAAEAAAQGAKESEQYISKYGRARSYKEETIGTPDAGAVSTALFFEGFAHIITNFKEVLA